MQSWMIGLVVGMVSVGFWPALLPWYQPLLLVVAAVAILRWTSPGAKILFGLACGCSLGLVYGSQLLQSRLVDECVGIPLLVTGRVSSLPSGSRLVYAGGRQRFEFTAESITPERCSGPVKLALSYYGDHSITPGDRWQLEVNLRKPWGLANPGSFNLQGWYAQEGIDGVGSVRDSVRTRLISPAGSIYGLHNRLRLNIRERIEALEITPRVGAVLRAITVADKDGIEPPLWQIFQHFGINHLLVISGLHIGMVAAMGYVLGGLFVRLFRTAPSAASCLPGTLALLLACLYGALAGFSVATQRAVCMLVCFVVAGMVGRRSDSPNNLLLAASVVLVCNPLAALGSGFWLSFGAVAGLLWLSSWQRGASIIRRLLGTHGFMSMLMLPLGALFFGGGSLVAMAANLFMIPLVGLVIVPLGLLAIVSFLFGWPLETALWRMAGWPLEQLLPLAESLSSTAGGWLYLSLRGGVLQVLLGALATCLLILPGARVLKLLAAILALPLLLPPDLLPPSPSLDTEVTVLDVGQGTAVLVRSGDRALLYDTGGGDPGGVNMASLVVRPYLQTLGISSLDTVVISHPDRDHSAGTGVILGTMDVDRLRYGGETPWFAAGRPCIAGESWRWPGGQVFQFLSPALESPQRSNDRSCVLQVQVGDYRLLLPGDIEKERERVLVQYWGGELGSDWLLVGHHGSRTSSTGTFLKHVRPTIAVISSGYVNRFGHPHPDVIRRLELRGVQLFSTAEDGALEYELAPGKTLRIDGYRSLARRYWM